jgi:hypothetical protein
VPWWRRGWRLETEVVAERGGGVGGARQWWARRATD